MVVRRLQDPDEEQSDLNAALREREQARSIRAEPPDKIRAEVNNIALWQKTYPGLPAGQVVAFAQAGIDPRTPDGKRLATQSVKSKAKKPSGLAGIGEQIRVKQVALTRGLMMAIETPFQELQGVIRGAGYGGVKTRTEGGNYFANVAEGIGNAGRSSGWKAIENLVQGEEVDAGSGFFTGGALEVERRRDSERLQINGQPITTGRVVARRVSEPGTVPYNTVSGLIDMSVALTADPTAYAGRSAGLARRSAKTFAPVADRTITGRAAETIGETVGLTRSHRVDVDPQRVQHWLMSDQGRQVKEKLREVDDFDDLWRLTNKKLPVMVVRDLADAKTPERVDEILGGVLGTVVRDKPVIGGFTYQVKKSLNGVRLAQRMPGQKLDIEDPDQAIETLDAFMRNAKLDDPFRKTMLRWTLDAIADDDRQGVYNVISDVMSATGGVLQKNGVDSAAAKRMTQIVLDYNSTGAKYNISEITGMEQSLRTVTINGVDVDLPKPHLLSETLNRVVNLPDAREIRRATSKIGRALNNPAIDVPVTTLDWVMQDAWKPITLLRGAWMVRVVGEEQLRMAASGLHSAFAHPVSWFAWMLADDGVAGRAAAKVGVKAGRGGMDVTGAKFTEDLDAADIGTNPSEFVQAQSLRSHKHRGRSPRKQVLPRYDVYQRGTEEYVQSWADELIQLHSDDVARAVAQHGAEWAKAWFRQPDNRFRRMLAQIPENDDLLTDVGADAYIDTVAKRIQAKTSNDSRLIDAVASGDLLGNPLLMKGRPNRAALDELTNAMNAGVGPQFVKGDMVVTASRAGQKLEQYDRFIDSAFGLFMGVPTSKLSRSPVFKQTYWQRLEELIPFADAKTRSQIIEGAERNKLQKSQVDRMRGYSASGDLDLTSADAIAKGYALEQVKALLYDNAERSQFFDVTRLIFPFGEAWKEVLQRWGGLVLDNPAIPRRFQQTIEGARGEETDEFGVGTGFFHENANGDEVFTYPFSQGLTEKLIGVPVPLTGRVQGLSLMSEVLPGVGPVVQIPAGYLIPNKPEFEFIRDQLLPFGEHETKGGFAESFFPPWMQKMRSAGMIPGFKPSPAQDRLFGNTVGDVLNYMLSSGEYPRPTTEAEMADLVDEATERARHLYIIRGGAQFFAPSAPTPEMLAADASGNLMVAQRMVDDLHAMQEENYDTAFGRWLEKYGDAAYVVAQPKSKMLVYGAPVTKEGEKWVRQNGDIKRAYPNVYGFFAPTGGEFDFDAWRRVVESGEAEPLSPIERLKLANARIAREMYEAEKAQYPTNPTRDQAKYLSDFRKALEVEYPGFGSVSGIGNKIETSDAINELAQAVKNPKLAKTGVGVAVKEYLTARAEAQQDADAIGLSGFQSAKKMRGTRDWLRDMANALVVEHPDFTPIWEQVFERELADDVSAEADEADEAEED